ncbi:MAG: ATP-binding cassette domain-containing protein, partial [Glaciimonas sp.]|nr:ATP-binding cassette domain-containing protein [Glaciimonas sp.]
MNVNTNVSTNTNTQQSVLLEAKNLSKHYHVSQGLFKPKATAKALDGISFVLTAGKTLAVVGESGCGKSTLARQITMIEPPTGGELWMDGANIAHADSATLKRVRPLVQMVFQNPYASLNPRKKVSAMLEEPLIINTNLDKVARAEKAQAMMAKVGLRPEHYNRYPHM